MAGEIATAFVSIMPSFQGGGVALTQQLNKSAGTAGDTAGKTAGGKFTSGFGGALGKLGAVVGGAFAGVAVAGFLKDAIGGASDLNETVSKATTIFGDQAPAIRAWASDAATNLGLSQQAALDAAAGFGNMFEQLGFAGDTAASMSKDTVGLAADLGSFNNLPTADVSQRIAAAFRGEYDSLQTLIPNINAARVEQEAMATTGKANAKELTAQEKAAAVLAIVTKDGAAAIGDFAKTSDGAANKQKILTAKFDDLKSVLGQKLLPAFNALLDFGGKIIDFFSTGGDKSSAFGKILADVGPVVKDAFAKAKEAVKIFFAVVGAVFRAVKKFITDNMGTFKAWFGTLKDVFTNIQTLVMTVVGFILAFWKSHGAQIMAVIITLWETIKTVISSALTIIKNIIAVVVDLITGKWGAAWEAIKNILSAAWEGIKSIVGLAIQVVQLALSAAWALILSGLTLAWDGIKAALSAAWEAIKGYFDAAVTFISGIPQRIVDFLTGMWNFIATEAKQAKDDFIAWLQEGVDWVKELPTKIFEAIGDLSNLLYHKGEAVIDGLIAGMQNRAFLLGVEAAKILLKIKDLLPGSPVKSGPLRVLNQGYAGGQIVRMLADGMTAQIGRVRSAALAVAGAASGFVPDLGIAGSPGRLSSGGAGFQGSGVHPSIDARTVNYFPFRRESPDDTMRNLARSAVFIPGGDRIMLEAVAAR